MTSTKKKSVQDFAIAVYDGSTCIGFLDEGRDGSVRAYDASGALVGAFTTQRAAARAIPAVPS